MVPAPVKAFKLLRRLRPDLSHKAHHLAPGHLGVNAFLQDLTAFQFSENTGYKAVPGLQIFLDAFCIFLRSQIDQHAALIHHFPVQGIAPEIVKTLHAKNCRLRTHFQPVGHDPVHGLYQAVKCRQDPQVFLHIIILAVLKNSRRHVGILDAVIGQDRRRQLRLQVHRRKTLCVLPGDLIIARPKRFLVIIGKSADLILQKLSPVQKNRKTGNGQGVRVDPHLLCR